jgi:TP53 regulating kinase and related kinases
MEKIIQQGAEAIIIKKGQEILKRRVVKGYRLRELDEKIRKLRTRGEGKILEKASQLISVPKLYKVDEKTGEIDMEFIEGRKLSDGLDGLENWKEVCLEIGKNIGKLHDAGIIHGDLTTSNMILATKEIKPNNITSTPTRLSGVSERTQGSTGADNNGVNVYFIDFGLSFGNGRIEDKAVDLHLIKQALEAKHFGKWEKYFESILKGYGESGESEKVMKQFVKVERRGRYKLQF